MGDTQPRTFKLSPSALLSFPVKVLSADSLTTNLTTFQIPAPTLQSPTHRRKMTAVVDVKLDDVLERKHLPPLGLKDFEEWLLFVEQNAENLYFILWLKDYNARYTQWMNNTRAILRRDSSRPYQSASQLPSSIQTNRALALFYSRAKQTFFTPNSPYELDLPSDILGPFHAPSLSSDSLNNPSSRDYSASSGPLSPHPDPAVFSEVEERVRSVLQESLDRFASSAITNVGTARATCGLIGGTVIALAGFLPPIAVNFTFSRVRWLRILAFPGLWLGLTIVLASLRGVCMMIYVFGDLRQLRLFELARPSISSPQRLRPLRNNPVLARPPPPQPEPGSIPIRRPPIIPKPVYEPDKSFPTDDANPRVTLSSVFADSFTTCDSDASRTSTSSEQVEIHVSEAFQDIEPPYIGDDLIASSPVPSSWHGESPSATPSAWIPHLMAYNIDSSLTVSPPPRKLSLPVDNVFRVSNPRTSTTLDKEEESEKWIPTATFIRPFEYNEWEEWDGESIPCTTEGSLGGYGGGDEESRISHLMHPARSGQDGPRAVGPRMSTQFRGGSRREAVASSKGSDQYGMFDFDALPVLQGVTSSTAGPIPQRKPRYRSCDASPAPPLNDETSLTEASRQGGQLRMWLVDVPRAFIRRTQGKCGAAKQVIKDVLTRSAREASRRNGGDWGAYRDTPEMANGAQTLSVVGEAHRGSTLSTAKEKGKLDAKQVKRDWRVRWKQVMSVPAFKSPLTKILSPVVTRAQWEVVVRSGILAFVISLVIMAIFVAVPVPP